jgi:NADPH-dependent 2,4-dienoyl-CoA reductase/sulfur reductase-like enzyme/rhodanese-related sulfurtransferase
VSVQKLVIVGGVAGGATAAARARRLSEQAEIVVLERGEYVSFANCGLPYHVGGEIAERDDLLVQTVAGLTTRFRLDIRTRHEVIAIDRAQRTVRVRELASGREYDESYEKLLLSPGAEPIRPPLPGIDHPQIFTLRTIPDVDRIKVAVDGGARSAIVVGGGFIGLEMTENLRRRGLAVQLVELLPQVMPPLDPEMAEPIQAELRRNGVALHLDDAVERFEDAGGQVMATLRSGTALTADLVILSVGVRPETGLGKTAGLEVTDRGALVVNDRMRTNDPHIYGVGDAVQVHDVVLDQPAMIPLAGPANRQARIAVDNIFGRDKRFRGSQGTSVVRVFDLTVAATGAAEKRLQQAGREYRKVYLSGNSHVGYFPGAAPMTMKLLFTPDEGRILGAQIVGSEGVDKRIDVLAVALQAGLTVYDLEEVELAYAPQYGAAKDPVNMLGFVGSNLLRGDVEFVYAEELGADPSDTWTIVDVRGPDEYAVDRIPGAISIPLPELRARIAEIPTGKPVAVCCHSGQRSYYGCRVLMQHDIACRNVSGGMKLYRLVHPAGMVTPSPTCG